MSLIDIRTVTGNRLAQIVTESDFAALPIGSIEWHGPHLPLGTDTLIAQDLAASLDSSPHTAVLYPPISYTSSPGQTRSYPGTIGITPDVMVGYYVQVLESIIKTGFNRIALINAHDANMSTMRAAMEWVSGEHPVSLLLVNWFQLVPPHETTEIFGDHIQPRGHGGAFETAGVYGISPASVDLNAVEDLPPRPKLNTPTAHVVVDSHPSPWDGWSGHISEVTPERSEHIRTRAHARLSKLINAWLEAPAPQAPGSSGSSTR